MKALLIKLMILGLNVIYLFFKPLKVKNKIVMISRQSNEVNLDFKLLGAELEKDFQVVYLCKTLDGGVDSTLFTKILYGLHMFVQMYHLATSKVCVLDSYSPVVSLLKHKSSLKVVQIWHSVGSLKQFGWQVVHRGEGTSPDVAAAMKMHNNYDVVYCAGNAYKSQLAAGFKVDESKLRIFTLPRIDMLFDESYLSGVRKKIFSKYPQLEDKCNIVYAPTFRKDESTFNEHLKSLVDSFDFEKYNLVVKLHPLSNLTVSDSRVIFDKDFSTFEMLSCADKLVSDYSCVIYEAGVKGIPLYFYNFDMEDYINRRGLTIDYNSLPGFKSSDAQILCESFEKEYDYDYHKSYMSAYVENTDACAYKMAEDIKTLV